MSPATHYKHSGKAPFVGVFLTLIIGLIAGVILGVIYGFLIYWSPFVYVNAFITFGFGIGLAILVGTAAKMGKVRNSTVVTVLALLVALVAYVAHWSVWIGRMAEMESVAPGDIWALVNVINTLGPWSIFNWTPTGFALWAIWGIEALVIVGIGTFAAHGTTDVPFCEDTGQWTKETKVAAQFAPLPEDPDINSPGSLLGALHPVEDNARAYTAVSVATAEGSELRCATLTRVTVETDKDGKDKTSETTVVKDLLLDRQSFEKLTRMGQADPGMEHADPAGA
jgi:hypothetical protein